jgi:kojibiose phosphorylase
LAIKGDTRHLRPWGIETDSLDPDWVKYFETIMTQGNGYLGTRGSFEEPCPGESGPLTLLAGIYDTPAKENAVTRLAAAPNWLLLRFHDGTDWFSTTTGELLEHRRTLSFRTGILKRDIRWRSGSGRITRLVFRRFVSMARPNVCAISLEVVPENYSGSVTISSELDCAAWYPDGVPQTQLVSLGSRDDVIHGLVKTREEAHLIAEAARTRVFLRGRPVPATRRDAATATTAAQEISFLAEQGERYVVEKLVSVFDSVRWPYPLSTAFAETECLPRYARVEREHSQAWGEYWRGADIRIEGDAFAQSAARFFVFHLLQAASKANVGLNLDASVPAKCLSGPGYNGHVFWDTEIYMLPFFTLEFPEIAQQLLRYRFNRIGHARANAAEEGGRGAKFPWESAGSGAETTPKWVPSPDGTMVRCWTGEREIHVVADVAFGVWRHYLATGDEGFLRGMGLQLIVETARYWAYRAERTELPGGTHQYVINEVIPPNEFHECVNNSLYTNALARWNIGKALELLEQRKPLDVVHRLAAELAITPDELAHWRDVAEHMRIPYDGRRALYEESDGFFALEDLSDYSGLGYPRCNEVQVCKQADVLLALYLLPEMASRESFRRHYEYYVPRTVHTSSLSAAVHVLFSLMVGRRQKAYEFFLKAASIDAARRGGACDDGLHGASLGGGWQSLVFGFGGISVRAERLEVNPDLPDHWRRLRFGINFRGARIDFDVTQTNVRVRVGASAPGPVRLCVQRRFITVPPGRSKALSVLPGNPEHPGRIAVIPKRRLEMMIFDWDGTAVPNRYVPIGRLKGRTERLLADGFVFVVVTGTHLGNVWNQFVRRIRKNLRKGIIVCCNRGSEVYGFDDRGRAQVIFRRTATDRENRIMDEMACQMQQILAGKGIHSEIVWDRMNRRKVDLLPGREVEKAGIGEALADVQGMLTGAGIAGGIRWATDKLFELARKKGLKDMCLTSDVKHLEFGLTDKSHSVDYVMQNIAPARGLRLKDIIFVGDEFGEVGGFIGSDSLMMRPTSTRGGLFVSVGKEPKGVPPGVVHYRRGPAGFLEMLDAIAEVRQAGRDRD